MSPRIHLQFDTESWHKAGQLDVILKIAPQVVRPCDIAHTRLWV